MSDKPRNSNRQKTHKKTLRIFPYGINLKIALASPQANQRVRRNQKGGKVDITQPPHVSGFFMSANLSGDNTSLPGGYGIKNRLRGNTCGASFLAPTNSRQFCNCHNRRNKLEITAMNNANTHGTATPVAATRGASPTQCNNCLLPSSVLTDAIQQAKAQAAKGGKFGTANGYAQLLKSFHAVILPGLIDETGGNVSKISRLLGLDRRSVIKYAGSVGLLHLLGAGQGGARR